MEIEIKVMWCKGLQAFNFFQKLTIYATVCITTKNDSLKLTQDQKQEQKTPVDDEGDGNPEWNHAMKFDLRPLKSISLGFEDLYLLFELRNQGQLFGNKTIGEVCVPLTELFDSVGGEVVRFVKYEVRSPEGKHNGILDFSYKIIGNTDCTVSSNHYITGYHHHHHHSQLDDNTIESTNLDTHVMGYHHHLHYPDGNIGPSLNSDTHVIGYHHHHQHSQLDGKVALSSHLDTHEMGYHHHSQLDGNTTNSDTHVMGYHHHHSQLDESVSISESEKIQYPKIDLEENPALPLVYPPPVVPALHPPPPPQMWGLPPPLLSHYPPQPSVYPPPPPPPQHQQPYGDPRWGYNWLPEYHHW